MITIRSIPVSPIILYDNIDPTCRTTNCNKHGTCLIGKCFCYPGYTGNNCSQQWNLSAPKSCTATSDDCFYHPEYGIGEISYDRWMHALSAEKKMWGGNARDDRSSDHLAGFNNYKELPNNLGDVLELGCGPFTQTRPILNLKNRQFYIKSITLWEPSAIHYVQYVKHCVYKNGKIIGFPNITTIIVSAGAEQLRFMNSYDTIIIINVLEHVQNAYEILQNIYNALRPNGTLVLGERWWDHYNWNTSTTNLDRILHPIRIKYRVWEYFTNFFKPLYDARNHHSYLQYGGNGSYYIGTKKK
ncbi:unnamed protein product [Rotaria sordida]|uniref:EGF-like domain-containing protein n=2 Tax=Rotaria sordida TaxID=392033 RepID=A0A814SDQ4_9BILA|nr:unnamed protein product [Rotaria sordida]CAF4084964.1 unnamed protein product [Rotaria sordida]